MSMTFHYYWKWSLKSSPEQLWPYVSNTDRFRASTGFPSAKYTEEVQPDGSVKRIGRLRIYGFPFVWEEEPFEWVRNREVVDTQRYSVGAMGHLQIRLRLERRGDGGTDVYYDVAARTGNILGYPGIPVQIGLIYNYTFGRAYKKIDQFIQQSETEPFNERHTPLSLAGRARLRDYGDKLVAAGYESMVVNRLLEHLRSAPDHELTRMRPYAFADVWKLDRQRMLEMFLQATKIGLLDLSWDMLCPECRGAKHQHHTLHDISHAAYCPSCNVDYEVDFAKTVEATFQVNQAVKAVVRDEFCLGSPQNTPHVLMQQAVAPGETRTVHVSLEASGYRWRVPKLGGALRAARSIYTPDDPTIGRALLTVQRGARSNTSELTIDDNGIRATPADITPGEVALTISNKTDKQQVVVLEQTAWTDLASTAAEVTTLQSFRDLFSSEVLRPGESIGVERLAIMFTDLKGSTAMYRTVGDAPAFRRVMDHFGILREGVAKHHGAVVKTIGDAIMAVFTDPEHALEAAFEILDRISEYNATNAIPLMLKMGIHQGTCIAVTLNERLDYFGSVVNLAARLEGQSQGEDVVVSDSVYTDPAVEAMLKARNIQVEDFSTELKGFGEAFALHRLTLTETVGEPV
jgi:class 3 adenylate cyclase